MLPLMTADEFIERRFDLPESGQWSELDRGVPTSFQPPDVDHGTVILNLSKAFASYVQAGGPGYACFDLGLLVGQRPDSIRFPAACYFLEGPRFAEADRPISETVPALVVELASTNDRRRGMTDRVLTYHEHGVSMVWVIDPQEKSVHLCPRGEKPALATEHHTLRGDAVLPRFTMPVTSLFQVPDWWK